MVTSYSNSRTLFQVSFRWCRIHHGPPSMRLFLSNSTHHLGISLRKKVVPWYLSTLMTYFLYFNNRLTSLTFDLNIQPSVRNQNIYSHSEECTGVPWGSLTSMVISLALVNGFHHWPVIKWFLPCSTWRHVITWIESYFVEDKTKILDIC